jgi:hypothetical protein
MPSIRAAGIATPSPILAAVGKLSCASVDVLDGEGVPDTFVGAPVGRVLED